MARDEWIANTAVGREQLLSPRWCPANIRDRLERAFEPDVAPLNDWVARLKSDGRLPVGAARTVPLFDPRGGGVNARVLLLQQDPSEVATFTGFCSPDNNDPTAHNATLACRHAGLPYEVRVHWNVFPWWVNIRKNGKPVDSDRAPETYRSARALGAELATETLGLLPKLKVIVLLGREAQKSFRASGLESQSDYRKLVVLRCGSFSPQSWNNRDPDDPDGRPRRETIVETLRIASEQASAY